MSNPFLAEIRIFPFNFPPKGWALCDGQLLPINQNQALFSLLGTVYGGNGQTNFALPDLQGRTPMHMGNGHVLGEKAGEQGHTLSISEIPTHVHVMQGTTQAADVAPAAGNLLGSVSNVYTPAASLISLNPGTLGNVGGSQAHLNMQPFLVINFCIALQGIFPSQT